jgi:8-oxo-dGTP diphosphatase
VTVILRGQKVLMQYKLRGPFINVWNLPGGKLEEGEEPKQGAIREVREETGLDIWNRDIVVHLLEMEYHEVCPAILHVFAVRVPESWDFILMEDEPLEWANVNDVMAERRKTAGHLNVPHFVALAVESLPMGR